MQSRVVDYQTAITLLRTREVYVIDGDFRMPYVTLEFSLQDVAGWASGVFKFYQVERGYLMPAGDAFRMYYQRINTYELFKLLKQAVAMYPQAYVVLPKATPEWLWT